MDARERLHHGALGYLQRTDDALPSGDRLDHESSRSLRLDVFARPAFTYQGLTYITNLYAPLFIHQYSHAWFDFRNKQDAYANYFHNSVTATQAHKLFCLSLQSQFSDYQSNSWGITASDSASGYT